MEIRAYAKINWDLHILGRRADGFHELDSIFVNVDFYDVLTFSPAADFQLTCSDPTLPCDETNLVVKAARALSAASGHPCTGHIHLRKQIPMGGGMGGGSSDCAAALRGLNQLWNVNWGRERLHEIGAKLGSDVSYFLYGGWCRCRGRGEIVEPLNAHVPKISLLLLFPGLHVPTPAVYKSLCYSHWDGKSGLRALTALRESIESLHQDLAKTDNFPKLGLRNDLTEGAKKVEPRLIQIQQVLDEVCPGQWLMSGSGATHFVVLRNNGEGVQLGELLKVRVGPNLRVLTATT
ncbi:MAG TPA: 4-(cytidine 5'-diphospho)-2-C-methyl-D-erythritol kinase, partial [Planctomycetota bacterium]|nr:4-(cytidine 5'-diphospho)-2-C-methyl-D-erythritol kinase [Planctomycetota bacterium]